MKLRNLSVLLFLSLLAIGCQNASRSFKQGRYDDAIHRSITVLNREPSNKNHLEILRDAYRVVDANDKEQILALRQTGEPDIWGRIVSIYERMIARNRKIDALPSSVKNEVNFVFQSHNEELIVARQRAAEFHYAAGVNLLNVGKTAEARQAFANFEKVIVYAGADFRDVRELRARAEELGTLFVLFTVVNNTAAFIHPEAVWHLTNIQLNTLNRRWVQYHSEPRRSRYQYEVTFSLDRRIVFPTNVNTRRFTETRTITDGTEIQTDSRGKPVLDSAGNVVRVPKRLTLRCTVTEFTQERRVRLDGTLTYFDVENQRLTRSFLLNRTLSAFSTTFSTNGDLRALSDRTRRTVMAPFIPLPSDDEIVVRAAENMAELVRETLLNNRSLIR
jgi:hypothetical protein